MMNIQDEIKYYDGLIKGCLFNLQLIKSVFDGNPGNWREIINLEYFEGQVELLLAAIKKVKDIEYGK
jgi:hypothetical protein